MQNHSRYSYLKYDALRMNTYTCDKLSILFKNRNILNIGIILWWWYNEIVTTDINIQCMPHKLHACTRFGHASFCPYYVICSCGLESQGPVSILRSRLTSKGIPIIKIRRTGDCLIFITETIPGKTVFTRSRAQNPRRQCILAQRWPNVDTIVPTTGQRWPTWHCCLEFA